MLRDVVFGTLMLLSAAACSRKDAPAAGDDRSAGAVASSPAQPDPRPVFHKAVGAPTDPETAHRWMDNRARTGAPRETYQLDAAALRKLLAQGAAGISLAHAVDDGGKPHILAIGVSADGQPLRTDTISTMSGPLSWDTARAWRARHAGPTRSHFFGADTFERLLVRQGSPAIHVEPALNDAGKPQLLLSNADDLEPSGYEDASIPCPDHCGPADEAASKPVP